MSAMEEMLNDPRRRNLMVLAGVTLLFVLLAIYGVAHQAALTTPVRTNRPVFPELAGEAAHVTAIHIVAPESRIDAVFKPEKGWVIANHGGYPASVSQVNGTLIGLEQLQELEPKTARPDWYSYVDLGAPEHGGKGTSIALTNDRGETVAAVVLGKTVDIGDPGGATGVYMRKPGSPQSWLARSVFEPKTDSADWLEKHVLDMDRGRIAETQVTPASGPAYDLRRNKPTDASFQLADMPKGRELAYDGAGDAVAAGLVDFSFDDVKPAKDIAFVNLTRAVTRTFDGLSITVTIARLGADSWAMVAAEGVSPAAQKKAHDINARTTGWAYKLPAYKAQQFSTPLESLLKPPPGPPTAH